MIRFGLFVLLIVALVSLPFIVFGEEYALPLLRTREGQSWALALVGVALLIADSVAPVPSAIVIVTVAAKTGWLVGTLVGTIGLTGQVLGAAWLGRYAVRRVAPRFFGAQDMARLQTSLQQKLALTLGCLRSVPVLAETSVIVAASLGIPLRRIFAATLLPNLVISAAYSIAADHSLWTACAAILASIAVSLAVWRAGGRV